MGADTDLMTAEEVAARLRTSKNSVYAWSKEGGPLTPIRVGKLLRYRRSDIDAMLAPPPREGAA